ncbi:hypothetical protein [Secundilactobacillus folii]|uniref:Uncharacterized protein n=1 Tax=Secundilactobacillus folii TaxID=2678357 RepID=A0A7X2XV10_9LACO|nr:hypothetical protein [Secundilactobacillus folii]MTV82193.1 hypothetical protein [Secundilactobacillus folii]
MSLWTMQNKQILDILDQDGIYYPDFQKSDYLHKIPKLSDLYNYFLTSFNAINAIQPDDQSGQGLIFCFMGYDYQTHEEVHADNFLDFIHRHVAINSLWEHLTRNPDNILLEVDFNHEFFNPLMLDINDFQILMPPVQALPPYTEDDLNRILDDIQTGNMPQAIMPSYVVQAHLPYLRPENILNVYHSS